MGDHMSGTIKVSVEMDKALSVKLDTLSRAAVGRPSKRAYIERILTEHVAKAEKATK